MVSNCKFSFRLAYLTLLTAFLFSLQACAQLKLNSPYATTLKITPSIIKTSLGNVEVRKLGSPAPSQSSTGSAGLVYLIPGFPGSSLENIPLAQQLSQKAYLAQLINPPGHGQVAIGNSRWDFSFPHYGQALFEAIQVLNSQNPDHDHQIIIAHSAGAEMAWHLLRLQIQNNTLSRYTKIVLINPWLPSLSNHPVPWTSDDEDLLNYPFWLVKLLGPAFKRHAQQRLFSDLNNKHVRDYLVAHEKLTENFAGWWPFDDRFVRLMKQTTRTQRDILRQQTRYELNKKILSRLDKKLHEAQIRILVINSAPGLDKVIPDDYKQALQKAIRAKLPTTNITFFADIAAGHMLQVEQPEKVMNEVLR